MNDRQPISLLSAFVMVRPLNYHRKCSRLAVVKSKEEEGKEEKKGIKQRRRRERNRKK